jgi:hypothetical protein
MNREDQKTLQKAMAEDSRIAQGDSEKEYLDLLEALTNTASDMLSQIKEHSEILGILLMRVQQAMNIRRIKALSIATKDREAKP